MVHQTAKNRVSGRASSVTAVLSAIRSSAASLPGLHPAPFLRGHTVTKAKDRGWDTLTNGDLLTEAEQAGFDVLLAADKSMRYQRNFRGRGIAIVVLSTPRWPVVRLHVERIAAAINAATPGSYAEVNIPAES